MSVNVLLVDDNPKYLRDALPFYGYSVDVAVNGLEAISMLSKNRLIRVCFKNIVLAGRGTMGINIINLFFIYSCI